MRLPSGSASSDRGPWTSPQERRGHPGPGSGSVRSILPRREGRTRLLTPSGLGSRSNGDSRDSQAVLRPSSGPSPSPPAVGRDWKGLSRARDGNPGLRSPENPGFPIVRPCPSLPRNWDMEAGTGSIRGPTTPGGARARVRIRPSPPDQGAILRRPKSDPTFGPLNTPTGRLARSTFEPASPPESGWESRSQPRLLAERSTWPWTAPLELERHCGSRWRALDAAARCDSPEGGEGDGRPPPPRRARRHRPVERLGCLWLECQLL